MTDRIYARDGEATSMTATVTAVTDDAVLLDRTVFYPGRGGQPCDLGTIDGAAVTEVWADAQGVWHRIDVGLPQVGSTVTGEMNMQMSYNGTDMNMSVNWSGKRLGDCD